MTRQEKVFRVHRALAILYGLMGLTFAWVLSRGSMPPMAGGVVLVMAIIFGTHAALAAAVLKGKSWARMGSMVVGGLMLLGFPIGTLIGVYLIYNAKDGWS